MWKQSEKAKYAVYSICLQSATPGRQSGNERVSYSGQVKYFEVMNDCNSSINEETQGSLKSPDTEARPLNIFL